MSDLILVASSKSKRTQVACLAPYVSDAHHDHEVAYMLYTDISGRGVLRTTSIALKYIRKV